MTFDEFIEQMNQRNQAIMDRLTEIEIKVGSIGDPKPNDPKPDGPESDDKKTAEQAFLDWMNGKEGD